MIIFKFLILIKIYIQFKMKLTRVNNLIFQIKKSIIIIMMIIILKTIIKLVVVKI